MPGTRSTPFPVRMVLPYYSNGAMVAGTVAEAIVPFSGRIGAVKFSNVTAGDRTTGTNRADVFINDVSIYAAAASKPTQTLLGTGEWTNTAPTTRAVHAGDRVRIDILATPTGGTVNCARVMGSVAIEMA